MGKVNNVMRHYVSNKRRFADLFNGVFFQGNNVIRADELTEASEQYTELAAENAGTLEAGERLERIRDIKMNLKSGEGLRILAVENQNHVDYSMPFRCMEYDSMEYRKQIEELKQENRAKAGLRTMAEKFCGLKGNDRLKPVYTLCLYHGIEKWDGPRCLKDMMEFGEDPDRMSRFFADYPLRLFCVNENADFAVFHTELREVFEALRFRRDKKGFRQIIETNPAYGHLDRDTVEVLSVLMQAPGIWEEREKYMNHNNENEEEYDMITAWQELLMDERAEGRSEGRSEGRLEGRSEGRMEGIQVLIEICREFGKSYEETKRQVAEKFGLDEKNAQNGMNKYWKE